MKTKGFITILGVLAVAIAFTFTDVVAKGGGGGGGFSGGGGRSFSSSSSFSSSRSISVGGGYSKPSATQSSTWGSRSGGGYVKPSGPAPATAPSSSGYTKPGSTSQPQSSGGYAKPSSTPTKPDYQKPNLNTSNFNKQATQGMQKEKSAASLAAYKEQNSKFKTPETKFDKTSYGSSALYTSRPVYSGYDSRTQYTVRNNYYTRYSYTPAPYVYTMSPSYGMFDTVFMFWMLDNMHHNSEARAMAYNYQNDAGYRKWREDAEKQAATNTELKKKLDDMDAQMKKMQAEGVKANPNYVPKDIPADVILSAQAVQAKEVQKPDLVFATGPAGGTYNRFGDLLKQNASMINVNLKETSGSLENLKMLLAGQADMAIVQSDVLKKLEGSHMATEQVVIYPEFFHLIVNSKSGITTVRDMTDGKCAVCMPKGSGTEEAWNALVEQDSVYGRVPVTHGSYELCLRKAQDDPKVAMFIVAGLNSKAVKTADAVKPRLTLVDIDDWDFNNKVDKNGNKIYDFYEIPGRTYPNLQHGFFWNHTVETIAVNAVLVVRSEWVKKYGEEAFEALTLSFLETKSEINKQINEGK